MNDKQREDFDRILDLTIKECLHVLDVGEEVVVQATGEVVNKRPSAAMLGRFIDFLNKYNIGRGGGAQKSPVQETLDKLREGRMKLPQHRAG